MAPQRGPVRGDRAGRLVRARHAAHVRHGRDLVEQPLHPARTAGAADRAGLGPDHDVDLLAGHRREALGEQVPGGAGVRAAGGVVRTEVAADRGGQADRGDERGEPEDDDQDAVPVRRAGEPSEGADPGLAGRVREHPCLLLRVFALRCVIAKSKVRNIVKRLC